MTAPGTAARYAGTRVKRLEDPRLLTGHGTYVDDIVLPGMLHACFVRSPFARARIEGIDVREARELAGVHAVFVAADINPEAHEVWFTGMGRVGAERPRTSAEMADAHGAHIQTAIDLFGAELRVLAPWLLERPRINDAVAEMADEQHIEIGEIVFLDDEVILRGQELRPVDALRLQQRRRLRELGGGKFLPAHRHKA